MNKIKMYSKSFQDQNNILCIGSFFTRNYGDRAIFKMIRDSIRAKVGLRVRPFPLKPIYANRYGSSMGLLRKLWFGLFLLPRHYRMLYKRLRRSSAVIIGGGNLIHDTNPLTVIQLLLVAMIIRTARRKFLIFAVGVGPLRSFLSRLPVSLVCRMSNGVVVRDTGSFSVINSCYGVKRKIRPVIVPDVVLALNERNRNVVGSQPKWSSPLMIGISTICYKMPGKYPGGALKKYLDYLTRLEELIRLIIDRTSATVLIFSTEPSEDQHTVEDLYQRLTDLNRVQKGRVNSLPSALDMTRSCDLHVGTRLHSLIMSLAQGVPSIAITSHGRITGLYNDLDAEDLLFDIEKFSPEDVLTALQCLAGPRGEELIENVNDMRERATRGLYHMALEIQYLANNAQRNSKPKLPSDRIEKAIEIPRSD
jgi:polysaccharide pyruvyl transferase WcaK-like protein